MAKIEINYNNIAKNIAEIKKNCKNVIAVVKNNAYNLDLKECVEVFYKNGINYFASTNISECVKIRKILGNDVKILLLNPTYDFATVREHNIEVNIAGYDYLVENISELKGLTLHLEFAGSMRRAGVKTLDEVLSCIDFCQKNNLQLIGFWSHFAFADEFDGNYEKEKELVRNIYREVAKHHEFEVVHLQNSASFLRDGQFVETTHIRQGINLYGANPYDTEKYGIKFNDFKLYHPINLYAKIVNIVELEKGECIGYSNSFVAEKKIKVGIVDVGYGDGVLRPRLKNNSVMVNGSERKVLSTMMSHIVVEIKNNDKIGDKVEIYNEKLQIHHYTKYCGTNSEQLAALNYNSLEVEKIF